MQPILSVEAMRNSDFETIRSGVSSKDLMWRAGEGIFSSYPWSGKVAIVCGGGNNAGDGYVLALLLKKHKIPCTVVLLTDRFSQDGRYYFEQCTQNGIEVVTYSSSFDFSPYTEIVDCILGTGFSGELEGVYRDAVTQINHSEKIVISADINSGLDGNNGCSNLCVQSDLTVSIGYYQYGHFLGNAKDCMKKRTNIDIGIDLYGDAAYLTNASDFLPVLKKRLQNSHKGTYGYVLLMGGCTEYSGAVKLAGMSCAALRSGCGVATLAVPKSIVHAVTPYLLESTIIGLDDENGHVLPNIEALDRAFSKKTAIAIGMGWGTCDQNAEILSHLLRNYETNVLIDADGLNTLAQMDSSVLKQTKCRVVLTPHPLEFSRLSGYKMEDILRDPIGLSKQYAEEYGVCLLLKGACTVVTDGKEVLLVDRGCAGMATAGSGDVLSGILAGLFGYSPVTPLTVACGAYIAGLAGELAEASENEISMLASDTVKHISKAISSILKK